MLKDQARAPAVIIGARERLTLHQRNLFLSHPLKREIDCFLGFLERLDPIFRWTPLREGDQVARGNGAEPAYDEFLRTDVSGGLRQTG